MSVTSHLSHHARPARPEPADVLGERHPLVRDLERLDVARSQSMIVAAMLAVGVGALVAHSAAGLTLVVAAAVAELVLGCRIAVLLESRRIRVLDLICEGGTELPIPVVERTCARLRSARRRQRLARSIETLLDGRERPFDRVVLPWQFVASEHVVGVRRQLRDISVLLRADDAHVQGIALTERLLTDGTSCLHGDDPRLLREELRRVRFLLEAARTHDRNRTAT